MDEEEYRYKNRSAVYLVAKPCSDAGNMALSTRKEANRDPYRAGLKERTLFHRPLAKWPGVQPEEDIFVSGSRRSLGK